ncbi:MAG: hypothetical protein KH304_10775 [Clostridium sp.]|nr:hypothetical protein [Clostridium sp.]
MKIIRYSKNNGALYIGTHSSKLCIFTRARAGYLAVGGKRIAQFGYMATAGSIAESLELRLSGCKGYDLYVKKEDK